MEIEVSDCPLRDDLVIAVQAGQAKQEVSLQAGAKIVFPHVSEDVQNLKVDVLSRLYSTTLTLEPGKENVYNLAGTDFGNLGLRLSFREKAASCKVGGPTPRKRIEDARVADGYIGQHELNTFGIDSQEPKKRSKHKALEYIERFGLRQLLQELFQRVIKERPEDPFNFMQAYLCSAGSMLPEGNDVHSAKQVLQPMQFLKQLDELQGRLKEEQLHRQELEHKLKEHQLAVSQAPPPPTELQRAVNNDQQAAEEGKWSEVSEKLQEQERHFKQLLEQQRLEVQLLQQQASDTKQNADHQLQEKHLLVESLLSRLQALEASIMKQASTFSTSHLESKADCVTPSRIEDRLDFYQPDSSIAVQNIAATLEAQRKTISALSVQLDVESKRREAAELHALTIEEAFQALQRKLNVDFNLTNSEAAEATNLPQR